MAIPSFFKQTKPRGFNYTPRYYDPAKEEMEQRRREWQREREARDRESGEKGEELLSAIETEDGRSAYAGTENDHPAATRAAGSTSGKPYRSKIMRGDMRSHFHRRQEKVRKQTTIRLLVIILIIVLFVYFYLRF